MPRPQPTETGIQLLVEGNDQRNFFEAVTAHLSLESIQVQNFGGVNELRRFLSGFVTSAGFGSVTRLGIVRDAETDAAAAFRSVQGSLRSAGLAVPSRPGEIASGSPSVSVLILPGGDEPGMLETLLCKTFEGDDVETCIDSFFECVHDATGEPAHRPDKARAHAYIATRREPHVSVGYAAQRGYWNLDHAAFGGVRLFLESM